jgi:hypothetical protein
MKSEISTPAHPAPVCLRPSPRGAGRPSFARAAVRLLPGLVLVWTGVASAATFYISPDGKDANPGTASRPFATLARARDAARTTPGPHTILLAPGRYFHTEPVVFDDRDSGLAIKGAKPGAVATLYGGVPVTGWQKWKGEIWRAPVPKGQRFFNLIVDDRPAVMARTPNAGSGYGGGAKGVKREKGAETDKVHLPPAWRAYDFSDAQIFSFEGNNWFSEMRSVLGPPDADGNVDLVLGNDMGIGRLYIRGVLEFLDEPGEWCLKHKDGYLYYWPARSAVDGTKSGSPTNHLIVRPTGERLLVVQGRSPQTPAKNIVLENLSIVGSDFCANWLNFPTGQDNSTPEALQQGMVFGENVEGLTVKNCRLIAAGHSAVWLNKHAQDCVVENNLIMSAGFVGVYMNGWTIGEGPFTSAAESYVNKGHRIESNFIYDCGKFIGAGSGIQAYQSGDNLFARNEITQMPRYGISYKSNHNNLNRPIYGQRAGVYDILHTRNIRIIGNDIYSVMRDSNDGGPIESWGVGRDNLWENNAFHDIDWSVHWTGYGVVVYADGHSNYLTKRHNIVYHCYSGYGTVFSVGGAGTTLENNFVTDCSLSRVAYASTDGPGLHVMRRNIFAFRPNQERYTMRDSKFGITEFDHNVVYPMDPANPNPERYAKIGVDVNSYFGDPGIIRAKPAWDIQYADYALKKDSPAYALGYKDIPTDTIGLRKDFPFDPRLATRRSAMEKIQAEDYQRMSGLRTEGGAGIHMLAVGAWAKYANIDFGRGGLAGVELRTLDGRRPIAPVQIHLDAPTGTPLAVLAAGQTRCRFDGSRAAGVHTVFLVFPEGQGPGVIDWFRFVPAAEANAWSKEAAGTPLIDLRVDAAALKAPMTIKDGALVGGNPQPVQRKEDGGAASWSFALPAAGKWALDILAQTPSPSEDSFFIDFGNQSFVLNNQITGLHWMWLRVGTVELPAGTHTLAIAQREPNAKIKNIRLSRLDE